MNFQTFAALIAKLSHDHPQLSDDEINLLAIEALIVEGADDYA